MQKAIIIEDEKNAANLLEQMIQDIAPSILLAEKCEDLPSGVRSIKKHSPDIVFLDIELPVYSGIQILEFFNPEEINFNIIFTTASNAHAVRAFEMSAVDYLTKPINKSRLQQAIEKITRSDNKPHQGSLASLTANFTPSGRKTIVVYGKDVYEVLDVSQIRYFEAAGNATLIFTDRTSPIVTGKNIGQFEDMLAENKRFLKPHKSYLINLDYIKQIKKEDGNTIIMENKKSIPASSEKMKLIMSELNK